MARLSIVIPAFNEEEMIRKAQITISELLERESLNYELIFVDDGSTDGTWRIIDEICLKNKNVTGIHFSRNFGKESAILAGLANIGGDCCIVMDCDLQHPPQTIIDMYRLWEKGYEVVEGVKRSRGKESSLHAVCASMFYSLMSRASKIEMSKASDFKLLDRKVVEAILSLPERNPFFRALSAWVGFNATTVEFDVQEREAGVSKWSGLSLVKYAITNITIFSSAPLQIVSFMGIFFFIGTLAFGIWTLIDCLLNRSVEGTTIIILLLLFAGSIIMTGMGVIGYYIAKIYEEVKERPRYIISQIVKSSEK